MLMIGTRILLLGAAVCATAAAAQTAAPTSIDLRVGKLEKEVRAVQRVVFPQGVPVQPELSATPTTPTAAGNAASAPIADLTTRVDTLEKQLSTLTGANEQNSYKIKQLEAALTAVQNRLSAVEGGQPTAGTGAGAGTGTGTGGPATTTGPAPSDFSAKPAATPGRPVITPVATKPVPPKSAPATTTKMDPARKAAVAAVEIPSTGDAVEDDYTYGFRLYTAKFYPEAQTKLKEFTTRYPVTQRRWSYAQNLLGRAYYDDGKFASAAITFKDNYEKAIAGERVVDSLTWLGQSLVKLKKMTDACKVYGVIGEDYATKLNAEQKARVAKGRADAKCAA